jgi:ubiquitin carboxyl-terminal hydrolase L3
MYVHTTSENNPEVMSQLALQLGSSPTLSFHDVYSFDDPDLLSFIPRPAYALLAVIPMTDAWRMLRTTEDGAKEEYSGSGNEEPVVWFKQTIKNACGLIGLLHCVCNGPVADMIIPGSDLDRLLKDSIPLKPADRANLLYESNALESAHESAAVRGDTGAPDAEVRLGLHFVAFVKGRDGHLWELDGGRKGPLDRGLMVEGDDALSESALELGLKSIVKMEQEAGGGDLRFSCIALAPSKKL